MNKQCILFCELQSNAISDSGEQSVHLIPAGTFKGRDGRGPWSLKNADEVIQASRRLAGSRQIPIDYDHQIDFAPKNGKPAPAAGWISGLQSRENGIWGLVKWTAKAAAMISTGEYRYISPVLQISNGEIKCMPRAALTNNPNLNELTSLFSADSQSTTKEKNMEEFFTKLAGMLGLEDGTDEAQIITAIQQLMETKQSGDVDLSKYVPIGEFECVVTNLNSLNQGVELQAAKNHVEMQIINSNMPPYLKDWGVALCSVNKPAFDAFIHRTKGFFNKIVTPMVFGSQSLEKSTMHALSDDEQTVCSRMGITAEEFAKSKTFLETSKG